MDDQSEFDPYDLLEIPAEFRPPTLYQLLGVDDFEDDLNVITDAAKQRNTYLHQIAAGTHRKAVQELLGEVAVARRTLLKPDAKQAYDAELMSLVEEEVPEPASPIRVVTANREPANQGLQDGSEGSAERQQSRTRRKKKSAWDEWKIHLLSASVLLTIVGVVWFVNRGGGERRAAKAGPTKTEPVKRTASTRKANATRPSTSSSAGAKKRKPVPKFRAAGPKLPTVPGFDLNIDAPTMSKPGENTPAAANPSASSPSKPKKKDAASLLTDWTTGLKVDGFTKPLAERYVVQKESNFKIQKERLVILPAKKVSYPNLVHKTATLAPGTAVAFTTNLRGAKQTIGFSIDALRFLLTPNEKKLEVRTRLHPDNTTKTLCSVALGSAPEATLSVYRPADKEDIFHWVFLVGNQAKTGRFQHKIATKAPKLRMVFSTPAKNAKPVVWIDNVRFGKPKSKVYEGITSPVEKF